MTESTEELPKAEWHGALEILTREHGGDSVTIEVASLGYGDQLEAESLPFAYIEYDPHDDEVNVGVGGRDGRYPVVLRHGVEHPERIALAVLDLGATTALEIVDTEGTETIVTLRHLPALPE